MRAELRLSPEQVARHRQLADQYLDSLEALLVRAKATAPLPAAKRAAALAELAQRRDGLSRDFGKRALRMLTGAQRKRLGQIAFQLRGVDAFFTPEMDALLGLDERQRSGIREVRAWLVEKIRRLRARPSPQAAGRAACAEPSALRREAEARIRRLLRPDQLDRLNGLRGRPIPFSADDLSMLLRRRDKGSRRPGTP